MDGRPPGTTENSKQNLAFPKRDFFLREKSEEM